MFKAIVPSIQSKNASCDRHSLTNVRQVFSTRLRRTAQISAWLLGMRLALPINAFAHGDIPFGDANVIHACRTPLPQTLHSAYESRQD
jgi:hypothetical protein